MYPTKIEAPQARGLRRKVKDPIAINTVPTLIKNGVRELYRKMTNEKLWKKIHREHAKITAYRTH
jgi:hypothetical protein